MLQIRALELPLRNCQSCLASGMENTRTTVPFSDAVANMVPVEFNERWAIGAL